MRSNENARRGTQNVAAIGDLGEESFIEIMAEYHENGDDDMLGGACVTEPPPRRNAHCIARPRKSRNAFFQTVVFGALLQPPLIRRCCDNCRRSAVDW